MSAALLDVAHGPIAPVRREIDPAGDDPRVTSARAWWSFASRCWVYELEIDGARIERDEIAGLARWEDDDALVELRRIAAQVALVDAETEFSVDPDACEPELS